MRWTALRRFLVSALGLALAAGWAGPARAGEWKLATADGDSFVKLGLLAQGQALWLDNTAGDATSRDLFLRRLRLLLGGQVTPKLTFFLDTDSPNLGRGTADGGKVEADVYVQDLVVTYSFSDQLRFDGGLLLIPSSYNSGQSAATLLPVDYGPYSFLSSQPTTSKVGRDYGLLARGLLFGQHLEYRAGVFQGYRGQGSTEPFRTVARVAWYPLEPITGFFYPGTSRGEKRIVSVGATLDCQDDYSSLGADLFVDLPVGKDGVTFQVDGVRWDGGETFTQLPEQDTLLVEAAYHFNRVKLSPFAQLATRDYKVAGQADEEQLRVGLAWWPLGFRGNLKLSWGRIDRDGSPDRDEVVLQAQVFQY